MHTLSVMYCVTDSHCACLKESQQRLAEYRDIASSLHLWMREKLSIMLDRSFPNTLIEMKKLAAESSRFRTDEIPPRQKDKQRLTHIFRELEVSIILQNDIHL